MVFTPIKKEITTRIRLVTITGKFTKTSIQITTDDSISINWQVVERGRHFLRGYRSIRREVETNDAKVGTNLYT
jgi:hypothetical protein